MIQNDSNTTTNLSPARFCASLLYLRRNAYAPYFPNPVYLVAVVDNMQQGRLALIAESMGAIHKLDLTSDVTHLIVGNVDTAKYKYVAKQRTDVKVLPPQWIEAMRALWIKDEKMDVEEEEARHRLPTFHGLRICLTGVEDLKERQTISELATSNGSQYEGNLTKNVTHLIAIRTCGPKYDRARQWGIKSVSRKWFDECIERGMVLEETLYDPMLPVEKQGEGAWIRSLSKLETSVRRERSVEKPSQDSRMGKRKLRRTASTKLGSQNANMWGQISGAENLGANTKGTEWQQVEPLADKTLNRLPLEQTTGNSPPKARTSCNSEEPISRSDIVEKVQVRARPQGLFQYKDVCVFGFDEQKTEILRHHLTAKGATVHVLPHSLTDISSSLPEHGFLMIPHNSDANLHDRIRHTLSSLTLVSEWWLESCLEGRLIVDPEKDLLSKPLPVKLVEGFQDLSICSTLFTGMGLKHLARAIDLMGASFCETLTARASILVCKTRPSPGNEKFAFAVRQAIPVVSVQWFLDSVMNGKKQPLDPYRLDKDTPHETTAPIGESCNKTEKTAFPRVAGSRNGPQIQGENCEDKSQPNGAIEVHEQNAVDSNTTMTGVYPTKLLHQGDEETMQSDGGDSNVSNVVQLQKKADGYSKEFEGADEQTSNQSFRMRSSALAESNGDKLGPAITELLAQKQSSRPSSAAEGSFKDRRKRTLGRACSGPLTTSSEALSKSYSFGGNDEEVTQEMDVLDAAPPRMAPIVPSQALTYEDPDTQKQRDEMIRRLGGKIQESASNRVQPVGSVKDFVLEEEGVGKRVRKRAKMALTKDEG
ncbi:MAG: hypothetical protein M1821_000378 [Bathelium mastoideum]|nr:MAG: hypothetical protein M1821_000378 [Bathelium mastoideum]